MVLRCAFACRWVQRQRPDVFADPYTATYDRDKSPRGYLPLEDIVFKDRNLLNRTCDVYIAQPYSPLYSQTFLQDVFTDYMASGKSLLLLGPGQDRINNAQVQPGDPEACNGLNCNKEHKKTKAKPNWRRSTQSTFQINNYAPIDIPTDVSIPGPKTLTCRSLIQVR